MYTRLSGLVRIQPNSKEVFSLMKAELIVS